MTNLLISLVGLTLLATPLGAAGVPKNAPAIACAKKPAAARDAGHGHEALMRDALLPVVEEVRPLVTGYAFRFPARGDLLVKLASWVTGERECCGFLTFVMRLEAGGDAIWLELTGPEGAKDVLSATLLPPLVARRVAGAAAP